MTKRLTPNASKFTTEIVYVNCEDNGNMFWVEPGNDVKQCGWGLINYVRGFSVYAENFPPSAKLKILVSVSVESENEPAPQ